MTRDEWLDTLDKLVAEQVMGWKLGAHGWIEGVKWRALAFDWQPTRSWADAGQVLETFTKRKDEDWQATLWISHGGVCEIELVRFPHTQQNERFCAESPEAKLTIVLAALKAHGAEIPEEPHDGE